MRVTNASTYRNFTTGANNVHARLIKSYNKVSSGEAYEAAADNPIAYYTSRKIDSQYQDVLSKTSLIKDVQNRIYQQELGARDVQSILSNAKNQVLYANTDTTTDTALISLRDDLLQKEHEIVDALNMQYQNFYVFGGNDISTPPFSLNADGTELTYVHTFPGEDSATTFKMKLQEKADKSGTYEFVLQSAKDENGNDVTAIDKDGKTLTGLDAAQAKLLKSMKEQGPIDIGYGNISDRSTLLDTYTSGLYVLTGLTSNEVREGNIVKDPANPKTTYPDGAKTIMEYMSDSPLALIGQAVQSINKYIADDTPGKDRTQLNDVLSQTITDMVVTEHKVSAVYSELGNKYRLLDDTADKLSLEKNNLTQQYTETWGADPYESIVEMYNSQQAYNAALKVGTNLLSSSLFDFMS